ncbi:MAG TPA: hypothetical protein VGQ46_08925 [Thermoanaerobaculia bacterium]|nr:hypothetical protein [Thermoanaerobaculia bacterium]
MKHWLGRIATDDYLSAEYVFDWSFYNQGKSGQATSAELFIEQALRFFGDVNPKHGSPYERGERLGRLVGNARTILLLDGLEPLQYPPGAMAGHLKDASVQALLRTLALQSRGLCVVTTREPITELAYLTRSTVKQLELKHLSADAGAQLLRKLNVNGSWAELRQATVAFGGHALALTLLGTYLRDACGGDVRRRAEVSLLAEDHARGGHAERVMRSYEQWLGDGGEVEALELVSLFDRPADQAAIDVLRAQPVILGLTERLDALGTVGWRRVVARLRDAALLAYPVDEQDTTLDTHPLVREYFGQRLRQHSLAAWRMGHNRLYEHLQRITPSDADTLEEIMNLYAAVAHGCHAGRHQDVLDRVYWPRIQHEEKGYSHRNFGTFGAELAAMSLFLDETWCALLPEVTITPDWRARILGIAAGRLRSVGRLREALEPFHACIDAFMRLGDLRQAAYRARCLSEVLLLLGEFNAAKTAAHDSVQHADKSGDIYERIVERTVLAYVLHQHGDADDADREFRHAEELLQETTSASVVLYSLWGFRFCDLLLDRGDVQGVRERVATMQSLTEMKRDDPEAGLGLLGPAVEHLALARAELRSSGHGKTDLDSVLKIATETMDELRAVQKEDFLPLGLLTLAAVHRLRREYDEAGATIDEALRIARRTGMKIHEADCFLELSRIELARSRLGTARTLLASAGSLIRGIGYHRRDRDLAELDSNLEGSGLR